jgi:hypothetical protein
MLGTPSRLAAAKVGMDRAATRQTAILSPDFFFYK